MWSGRLRRYAARRLDSSAEVGDQGSLEADPAPVPDRRAYLHCPAPLTLAHAVSGLSVPDVHSRTVQQEKRAPGLAREKSRLRSTTPASRASGGRRIMTTGSTYGSGCNSCSAGSTTAVPRPGERAPWFHRDLGLASPFVKGDAVRVVQKKTGADPDGVFGRVTQMHVVNFQSHHGLTADGIVGPETARALGP
jgi:peptidoglycan hydrolase-like protein with peptidoglycan-binding domain